jgi:uncharacterized membrane protein YeaQ/YmgE (transglycosylase-associated protein family)
MGLIWAVIAGLIVGVLARLVLPGKQAIPMWLTIVLGIAGAVAGNALASGIGVRDTAGVDWIRHALQIAAAAVLITVVAPMWAKRNA